MIKLKLDFCFIYFGRIHSFTYVLHENLIHSLYIMRDFYIIFCAMINLFHCFFVFCFVKISVYFISFSLSLHVHFVCLFLFCFFWRDILYVIMVFRNKSNIVMYIYTTLLACTEAYLFLLTIIIIITR